MTYKSNNGEDIPQAEIDTLIAYFMSKIPPQMRDQLNYSPKSLDVVEGWLQERYSEEHCSLFWDEYDEDWVEGEEIKPGWIPDPKLIRGAVFYIGEVHHKLVGGNWRVYKEESDLKWGYPWNYDAFPVIEGSNWAEVICPLIWIADAICKPYSDPVQLSQNLAAHLSSIKRENKNNQ